MHVPLKDLMFEMRSLEPFPGVAARVLEVAGRDEVVPSEFSSAAAVLYHASRQDQGADAK